VKMEVTHAFKIFMSANIPMSKYEGCSESKERFAIQRYVYLLIIGKKQNMQVLLHTFTYFST